MSRLAPALLSAALLASPALAQTQQPSLTTPGGQPSLSGPAPNLGSPQAEQNQSQQPANVRNLGPSGGTPRTGDTAGATKPRFGWCQRSNASHEQMRPV